MKPRTLSHDERRAAEAAFAGHPLDPSWSESARGVYDGIVKALPAPITSEPSSAADPLDPPDLPTGEEVTVSEPQNPIALEPMQAEAGQPLEVPQPQPFNREDAIEKGYLIDVSSTAHEMGLSVPIGMSRPLWDAGITVADQIPDEQRPARVRDVLMALRLHLASSPALPPVFAFTALLSFPAKAEPQVCPLYAVAQKDGTAPFSLTLLLPVEVSSVILPPSEN